MKYKSQGKNMGLIFFLQFHKTSYCICISDNLNIPEFLIFSALFGILKTFSGGFHAKNYWSCLAVI